MKKTSLYNHISIGTASKPLISNLVLKQTCEAIKAGNIGIYKAVLNMYTLEDTQARLLDRLYDEQLKK